jgi:superfamily II DNA or RNA helicase
VKHATGSGKTFTALFAMKRHLSEGGICLVIVPSRLLLQQWNIEIVKIIPGVKNRILNVGGGHSVWKKNLGTFSTPSSSRPSRIIVAIADSAKTDAFLDNLTGGDHLMVVSDEVHRLGSSQNSLILNKIESGARLGLSATPERFMDPLGTERIFNYFGGILEPIYELKDAIGKALVPYDYYPTQCVLTEDELDRWAELSNIINKLCASCKVNSNGELIPSDFLKLKLIERARIAKQADNKVSLTRKILAENYHIGEKWLVYCDSAKQMSDIAQSLDSLNISSSFYYSKMHDLEKEQALKNFKINGGILLSIKCLDEGIDIPSITHALIVASDQNPRQFIQRRGRVLRKDPLNPAKNKAYIWDIILTVGDSKTDINLIKGLCIAELKRSVEFSRYSSNFEISSKKLRDIARRACITQDDLECSLEDIEDLEEEKS